MGKRIAGAEGFKGRDVISIKDFSRKDLDLILDLAFYIERNQKKYFREMEGKIMAPLFFEPSTRTSGSLQMAMLGMGGSILDFDVTGSSVKKGENLRDTLNMIRGYSSNVVVIIHKLDGSARLAADILPIPVLNGGDGKNQHPTQTMLDLYTIKEIRGKIDGIRIALVGDLKYGRTVHSLLTSLGIYRKCSALCVAPEELRMPSDIIKSVEGKVFVEERNLSELKKVLGDVDIAYITRIQEERFPQTLEGRQLYDSIRKQYHFTVDMLSEVKEEFKLMHPLPKKPGDIEPDIEDSKYQYWNKQAENGKYIRQSLLSLILGGKNE